MASKNDYIRKIINSYGIIVNFVGEPDRVNVPAGSDDNETFKQWKARVLGDGVTNVVCYVPKEYDQRKTIKAILDEANARHIKSILSSVKAAEKSKGEDAVRNVKIESNEMAIKAPMDDLEDIVKEMRENLHPAAYDWAVRYIDGHRAQRKHLTIQELFSDLLRQYSSAVANQ